MLILVIINNLYYLHNLSICLDKYIDMVKNSDKDIYKLLEWKAKKDK